MNLVQITRGLLIGDGFSYRAPMCHRCAYLSSLEEGSVAVEPITKHEADWFALDGAVTCDACGRLLVEVAQ